MATAIPTRCRTGKGQRSTAGCPRTSSAVSLPRTPQLTTMAAAWLTRKRGRPTDPSQRPPPSGPLPAAPSQRPESPGLAERSHRLPGLDAAPVVTLLDAHLLGLGHIALSYVRIACVEM